MLNLNFCPAIRRNQREHCSTSKHWLLTICTVKFHDDDGHAIYIAWLGNQEGVSTLKSDVQNDTVAVTPVAEVASEGILHLESFLLMKYHAFAMQVAIAQPSVWTHFHLHQALCQTHLLKGQLARHQFLHLVLTLIRAFYSHAFSSDLFGHGFSLWANPLAALAKNVLSSHDEVF